MQRPQLEQIIRIGARGSPLSLAQTGQLRAQLATALGIAADLVDARLPIIPITTTGDRITDRALSEAGGKGLFTKELDEALLSGQIDCAVHSLKDVPTQLPDGIRLIYGPKRHNRCDALVSLDGKKLEDLKQGAVLGTSSLRRAAQLLHFRPDLKIVGFRGNVGTRLEKLKQGQADATILAAAGLERLGFDTVAHILLDPMEMPPAIGQGALAITVRADDTATSAACDLICDAVTALEVSAERGFLTALDGSCRTAIGAYSTVDADGTLSFLGEALSADGSRRWRQSGVLPVATLASAAQLGWALGLALQQDAGEALLSANP